MKTLPIIGYSLLAVGAAFAGYWAFKKMRKPELDTNSSGSGSGTGADAPTQPETPPKVDVKPYVPPVGQKTPALVVADKSNIAPDTPSVGFTGDSDYFKTYFDDYSTRMIKFQADV